MPSHDRSSGYQVIPSGRGTLSDPPSSEESGPALGDLSGRPDSPLQPRRRSLVVLPLLPLRFDPIRARSLPGFAALRTRNIASRETSGLKAGRMA